jgi:membrane protease YdiL (CAAX protease family)
VTVALEFRRSARILAYAPAFAIAAGCLALYLRSSSVLALGPTVAVGLLGIAGAAPRATRASLARTAAVTSLGIAAFVAVRLLAQPLDAAWTTLGLAANVTAAVAEEAFFRRFVYARLQARGATVAVIASAALFALVHIPLYGVAVLPLDFAAGLLLGWQRRESGTWLSPAVTHIVANLLQMR